MSEIPSAQQSINAMVSNFHNIAASHAPVSIGIGTVLAPPPEIQIAWNNIILEAKDLYIDQFLLPNYMRQLKGEEKIPQAEGDIKTNTQSKKGGHDKPRFISHTHKINNSYKASVEGKYMASAIYTDCGLQAGDLVSILPLEGGQKFIVLGKVIYMPEFEYADEENSEGSENDSSSFINF